jgi:hypothetical protein
MDEDAELVLSFLDVRVDEDEEGPEPVLSFLDIPVDEDEAEPPLADRSMGGSSFGVCSDTSIEVSAPRVERV